MLKLLNLFFNQAQYLVTHDILYIYKITDMTLELFSPCTSFIVFAYQNTSSCFITCIKHTQSTMGFLFAVFFLTTCHILEVQYSLA